MRKRIEKILVLVTAQRSALRLIEYGFSLAREYGGELHILHVQQGNSVFESNDTLRLLQSLVEYGGKRGGVIHLACERDIAAYIGAFAEREGVTRVVMGQGVPVVTKKGKKKKVPMASEAILAALPEGVEVFLPTTTEPQNEACRLIG